MKTELIKFEASQIIGPVSEHRPDPRSAGLHLSQIYQDIQQTLDPSDNSLTQEELEAYRAGGFIWEHVFSLGFAQSLINGTLVRPGEWMCEEIIGTPDLVRVDESGMMTVIDTKFTWKSAAKFDKYGSIEEHFWTWIVQVACYCRMMHTNVAELYVFFVNGDYRPPRPCIKAMRLEFSDVELAEYWNLIKTHARRKGWLK
jgi:hypothetical protein